MELKQQQKIQRIISKVVLIVPSGIETNKGTFFLSTGYSVLIVPSGIETPLVVRFRQGFFVLIVQNRSESCSPGRRMY